MKNKLLHTMDSQDRRRFMTYAASASLGVSLFPQLDQRVIAAESSSPGKAKRIIYLFMSGGMSHIDTFDLKPGHENQGSTQGIATSVAGCQISQHLPTLASQFGKMAVIRSMTTQTGDHEAGEYLMRTSYDAIATERHPSIGPWMQRLLGRKSKSLPDTVMISPSARHPGAGFFDPAMSPLPIADPNRGLENTKAPAYLSDKSFEKRIELINRYDKKFQKKYSDHGVKTYTDLYAEATTLLASQELQAFDLSKEKDADRDRYGRDAFGQGCLLARRLIENNVRCVEVTCGGWDMHTAIFNGNTLPARARIMDQAVGNLMKDLSERGLLEDTVIVLATEFGRSPGINYNAGRDHHPAVFSAMLAGAGIKGGQFYGSSDAAAHSVDKDGVLPADLNATVATVLGLSLEEVVISPTGRPFKVANEGKPITTLLS
jgi:uncharacterized protein (DUF1501 family)